MGFKKTRFVKDGFKRVKPSIKVHLTVVILMSLSLVGLFPSGPCEHDTSPTN